MRRALLLARRGWGRTAPNPMVGAVVVRDGVVVAEGWHAEFGGPHAEAMALSLAGDRARGAEVYVTLEPCAHHGKTPPCVDALIAAGVARVIVAAADPNPVAGGGVARLRAAGIAVTEGVERAAAEELNAPFFFVHRNASRPFITLKLAVSLDGRSFAPAIAASAGSPESPPASGALDPRRCRRGRGRDRTALADDPALTAVVRAAAARGADACRVRPEGTAAAHEPAGAHGQARADL
jgi:diaminohydroxyphosphoribosylaminopyrimidine deaminase/5-amino-6-(5-phosphoribosylamino)uracil reductase